MAFNILVELSAKKPGWKDIHESMRGYMDFIEFFPIPASTVNRVHHIGICVVNANLEEKKVPLKAAIAYFLERGNRVTELYSGSEFNQENIHTLIDSYLS